jgi:hypothetical protein
VAVSYNPYPRLALQPAVFLSLACSAPSDYPGQTDTREGRPNWGTGAAREGCSIHTARHCGGNGCVCQQRAAGGLAGAVWFCCCCCPERAHHEPSTTAPSSPIKPPAASFVLPAPCCAPLLLLHSLPSPAPAGSHNQYQGKRLGPSLANCWAGQRQSRSWAGLVGLRSSAKTAARSYAWREEGRAWCVWL